MVERGPEKAGVGGSIPSLATNTFNNLAIAKNIQKSSRVQYANIGFTLQLRANIAYFSSHDRRHNSDRNSTLYAYQNYVEALLLNYLEMRLKLSQERLGPFEIVSGKIPSA